jgi:hypothetical protein
MPPRDARLPPRRNGMQRGDGRSATGGPQRLEERRPHACTLEIGRLTRSTSRPPRRSTPPSRRPAAPPRAQMVWRVVRSARAGPARGRLRELLVELTTEDELLAEEHVRRARARAARVRSGRCARRRASRSRRPRPRRRHGRHRPAFARSQLLHRARARSSADRGLTDHRRGTILSPSTSRRKKESIARRSSTHARERCRASARMLGLPSGRGRSTAPVEHLDARLLGPAIAGSLAAQGGDALPLVAHLGRQVPTRRRHGRGQLETSLRFQRGPASSKLSGALPNGGSGWGVGLGVVSADGRRSRFRSLPVLLR